MKIKRGTYDITVVGGGIVGLATASFLTRRFPKRRIALIEKEPRCGSHQTGHNSGVIHSGVYYRPGSLKAALCGRGAKALVNFCERHAIPVERCGKVIVAVSADEVPRLEELHRRALANGVEGIARVGKERLKEIEPRANALQALHVPSTAIVDYGKVADALAKEVEAQGVSLFVSTRVFKILRRPDPFILETSSGEFSTRALISCAGLHSDRLAGMTGRRPPSRIIPFRGEYFELTPERRSWVRGLIYPVPDPRLPFLGVHLSKRIDGRVDAGPNAVLALKREGYRKTDLSFRDIWELLSFSGFWRMSARYWRSGLEESIRSLDKQSFVRAAQRLLPDLESSDLVPSGAGVRAQAVDNQGTLLDDFHFIQEPNLLHLMNAPSPAATASLAIGEFVSETAARQFQL